MFGIIVALFAAGCRNDTPCLSWVEVGKSYEVQVIERFDLDVSARHQRPAGGYPYSGIVPEDPSCEDALQDTADDRSISFEVTGLTNPDPASCMLAEARAEVPGDRLDDRAGFRRPRHPLQHSSVIHLKDGCEGEYMVAVVPVLKDFLDHNPSAKSDYMLIRSFFPISETPGCTRDLTPFEWCTDRYYVRVRDSSGEQISRDLSP